MLSETEITRRLTSARTGYVERSGKQPYLGQEPMLIISASGRVQVSIWVAPDEWLRGDAGSCAAALDALDRAIAMIPDEPTRLRNEFATALGKAIEAGRACGADVEFVNPLIEAMHRLSNNALEAVE